MSIVSCIQQKICNKLASIFILLSSTHNYSREFQIIKREAEKTEIDVCNDNRDLKQVIYD